MNRIIRCEVEDEYIRGAGVVIGAAGSHDDVELELTFSQLWAGTAKQIVWFDALGEDAVITVLTTSLMVPGQPERYRVPVPAEAKAVEGDMKLTIRGVQESVGREARAVVAATATFTVLPALWDPLAVESSQPSASVTDQLQSEIESIKYEVTQAAAAADAKEAAAESAAQAATSATQAANGAALSREAATAAAANASQTAATAAQAANSATQAELSAQKAVHYSGRPPVIRTGTWWTWDANDQAYTDTGSPARGPQGDTGPQGETGPQGVTGPQGPAGAIGPQGEQGLRGPKGDTGPQGIQGVQGVAGAQGPKGDKGDQGETGPAGPQGPAGATGPQGLRGPAGEDGRSFTVKGLYADLPALLSAHPAGAAGDAYAVGTAADNTVYLWDADKAQWTDVGPLVGPVGPQGEAGATGPQGPQGLKGDKGDTGPQGPQGVQGPKGDTGDTGATGPAGPRGDTGPTGPQGPAGSIGPAGPGLPGGGATGQVATKATNMDYDIWWSSPMGRRLTGQQVQPALDTTVTAAEGAEITNDYRAREFGGSAARFGNVASGMYALAQGNATTASGMFSHSEGACTVASGSCSHAEGNSTLATKASSHAEGTSCQATGGDTHAEGYTTKATGRYSHSEGYMTLASGEKSHAEGYNTVASADCQLALGTYNAERSDSDSLMVVGSGYEVNARSNCFRVTKTGVYAAGAYSASGADYAELFEWADGNPEGEDRAGRFVTLAGDKIKLATPDDGYILGIVSGNPSVVGDVYDDQWAGMYLTDVFGRPLWEDVEVPDETAEEPDPEDPSQRVTRVVQPAHVERRQRLNPAYDSSAPYRPRSQRPEWDAVGLVGKLVVVDDGSCQPDGWCTVGADGTATASGVRTRYRVMRRLDEGHVQVLAGVS